MTDQQAAPDESALTQAPSLFRAAPTVGRPPLSTSTNELQNPNTAPSQNPRPEESSTNPAPNSSTAPRVDSHETGPDQSPAGNSPSDAENSGSLADTIARGLGSVTQTAHQTLTDDVGRLHGLYLATEEELTSVGDGAASMLKRRLGPAIGSSELGDLIQIGLAVGSYVARTVQIWRTTRQHRAEIAKQASQQPAAQPGA